MGGGRSQRAQIRGPDRNNILGLSGNFSALIRAPGHKTFIDRSGSHYALIRALDRQTFLDGWVGGLISSDECYLQLLSWHN